MDELVVQYLLTNYPEEVRTRLAIGSAPLLVRTLHFAVRRDLPAAQSIVNQFDAELGRTPWGSQVAPVFSFKW